MENLKAATMCWQITFVHGNKVKLLLQRFFKATFFGLTMVLILQCNNDGFC